jgi:hypothetical protein
MKHLTISLVLGFLFLSSVAVVPAKAEEKDYGVMTAKPYRAEVQRGQERLAKFLSRLNPKLRALLDQTPYVAVEVYVLTAGEVPGLTERLGTGSVRSSQFAQDIESGANVQVQFLLIYDSRTQKLVGDDGVLVTDTPPRNKVGLFEGTRAVYVGTGW